MPVKKNNDYFFYYIDENSVLTVETVKSFPSHVCTNILMIVINIGAKSAKDVLKHCRY